MPGHKWEGLAPARAGLMLKGVNGLRPHLLPYRRSLALLAFPLLAGLGVAARGCPFPLSLPFLPCLGLRGFGIAGTLGLGWPGFRFLDSLSSG